MVIGRIFPASILVLLVTSHRPSTSDNTGRTVEDLGKRLAVLRASGKVADMFDKRLSKGEFKRPGKAEFKMTCYPTQVLYCME
jgi:hypothetical protein